MDFSQVKSLTIPEGNVTKITDSSGRVLWQAGSWHTVWEGEKKIGYGYDYITDRFSFGNVPYSDSLKLRISFSELSAYSTRSDPGTSTYIPADKVSPVTYDNISSSVTTLVRAKRVLDSDRYSSYEVELIYNKNTGEIYSMVYPDRKYYTAAKMTITKIEA